MKRLHLHSCCSLVPVILRSHPQQKSHNFSTLLSDSPNLLSSNLTLRCLCSSGRIDDARQLFDGMPRRDEYSWNTLITAYVRAGRLPEAAHLFSASPYKGSSTISWSFLISAHTRHGRVREGLDLVSRLHAEGRPKPDQYTLGGALRACSVNGDFAAGTQVHALAVKSLFGEEGFVVAGLVDMYAKCRRIPEASRLFNAASPSDRKNHVLWAAMVTGYAQNGRNMSALQLFKTMLSEGVMPNQFVLPTVLAACSTESALGLGAQVHGSAVRNGFESNDFVQCALVDMYGKCGDHPTAVRVLEVSATGDVVAWNSLLAGCARNGRQEDALALFCNMHRAGLGMDGFTYSSVLSCLGCAGFVDNGRAVHGLIIKFGFGDDGSQHVSNALLDLYGKCGRVDHARRVFDAMWERDAVAWTSLITGHARQGSHDRALELFRELRREGTIDLDDFLVAAVLTSCAGLAVLDAGKQVHAVSVQRGLDLFLTVGNSLVTTYAKCGCVADARRVFDSMAAKDAITWTSLIVGCAQNGGGRDSIQIYDMMLRSGIRPDYITFIGVLFACSHAGMVDEGRTFFESMEREHGVTPGPEHYASMIDLLGRAGRIREAADMVDGMVSSPDATVWKALLAACRVHRDVELAEKAAARLFELEADDAVAYVLLSNMYSKERRWSDVARVRRLMRARGIRKEPGWSWMEVGREVHVFRAEDAVHPRAAEVHAKVGEMMERIKEAGYVADGEWALHEEEEAEGKERSLAGHSEKLAAAFGLISLPRDVPIRIFKNLRVCGDCHSAMKFISKVFDRRIVLRDPNCFHHFTEGNCSCNDYW